MQLLSSRSWAAILTVSPLLLLPFLQAGAPLRHALGEQDAEQRGTNFTYMHVEGFLRDEQGLHVKPAYVYLILG